MSSHRVLHHFPRVKFLSALRTTSQRNLHVPVVGNEKLLRANLLTTDPEISRLLKLEKNLQHTSINLVASENYTSQAVLEVLGTTIQGKISEGLPGARYYAGTKHIDSIERLCQSRALEAFHVSPEAWGVNVQPYSGAAANLYAYAAVCRPHERILSMGLSHGGHLSHGHQTRTRKISKIAEYFETLFYGLDPTTGCIDYNEVEKIAQLHHPKLIIAGASTYSRPIDYVRMKKIATGCGAYLLADISHISGLIAADVLPSPFPHADIVTTSTYKTLRGPRGGLIFYRKGVRTVKSNGQEVAYDLEGPVNNSVFPGHQGAPHNHTIAALAVSLLQAQTPEFKEYQWQLVKNASTLANVLMKKGYEVISGGTENHSLLLDLRSLGVDGARVEKVLEACGIIVNKNTVPGDLNAIKPHGLRLGSPAMTTRGCREQDFEAMAHMLDRGIRVAKTMHEKMAPGAKLKEFIKEAEGQDIKEIGALRAEVESWAEKFPVPCAAPAGRDLETLLDSVDSLQHQEPVVTFGV